MLEIRAIRISATLVEAFTILCLHLSVQSNEQIFQLALIIDSLENLFSEVDHLWLNFLASFTRL